MGAGGCAGRYDGTVKAGLSDNVDLDGRVALLFISTNAIVDIRVMETYARVVDGTGVDLGDSHGLLVAGSKGISCVKVDGKGQLRSGGAAR
jgi:hypothetical protein